MICFVSLEHESWLKDPIGRAEHLTYCMDVKLKIEEMTGQPCLVQRYTHVTRRRLRDLNIRAVVLSGNATPFDRYEPEGLAELFEIIREGPWPILGLCGGHQLLAMAFGAEVAPMRPLRPGEPDVTNLSGPGYLKEWGFMPIDVVEPDPIFQQIGPAPEFLEVHYCEIKQLPPGFQILASSQDCRIQVIKLQGKPVYGTQAHPEAYTEEPQDRRNPLVNLVYPEGYPEARPDGRRLLANFFRIAGVSGEPGRG